MKLIDQFKKLNQRPLTMLGTIVVLIFVFLGLFGPLIAPYPFDEFIRDDDNKIMRRAEPSLQHPFGTDKEGRDVLSRVIWGTREIILLPGITTSIAVIFGTIIGLSIGYIGGWYDEIISRALDSLLSIPALVLALVMLGALGTNPSNETFLSPLIKLPIIGGFFDYVENRLGLIIVVVLLYTPIVTRVIRSATLGIRDLGYVEAARLRGESIAYILFREILPGVLPALTVEAALRFSYAIFLIASLGFLGLGVEPPSPDWGRMVAESRGEYSQSPWSLWAPAGAIAILIIGINLLADGLRRILRYESETI